MPFDAEWSQTFSQAGVELVFPRQLLTDPRWKGRADDDESRSMVVNGADQVLELVEIAAHVRFRSTLRIEVREPLAIDLPDRTVRALEP